MRYFLGLGSNLGQRRRFLKQALSLLQASGVRVLKTSSVYKTQPVGFKDQPWFYNQVVEIVTDLNPYQLLTLAKEIETKLKRPKAKRNGPRTIDVDLLLAEKSIIQTKNLVIPHPRMHKRRFVLEPLNEIAPEAVHPVLKKKITTLLQETKDDSVVIRLKEKAPAGNGKASKKQKSRKP